MQQQLQARLALTEGPPLLVRAGETLADVLLSAAESDAGITYVERDGCDRFQPYRNLLDEAQRISTGLREWGVKPEDKVLLQLDDRSDFIGALWACYLGGFVAVPVSSKAKLPNVIESLGGGFAIAESSADAMNGFPAVNVARLREARPSSRVFASDPSALALILITSGSSGTPNFVTHSHATFLAGVCAAIQHNKYSSSDISLNWLPLEHASGLSFHVRDVCARCRQVQAPLVRVLEDPLVWLDWIDQYRANTSVAPHFAYAMVAEHEKEIARRRWDLSCVRIMVSGGEPIVVDQARRFLDLLGPHGLATTVLHPGWGMSETATGVVFSDQFPAACSGDNEPAAVGTVVPGSSIRIVDESGRPVQEGLVGDLEVRGPSIMLGYLGTPNDQPFTEDGWLRTGDLGFIRSDLLTVTGRKKDLLIINGLNYSPYEIEAMAAEVKGTSTSYIAAVPIRSDKNATDRVAIFFYTDSADPMTTASEIRQRVAQGCGVYPALVLPVSRDRIRKNSLGKIQRARLRDDLENGAFDDVLVKVFALAEDNKPDLEALPTRAVARNASVMPRDMMEEHLREIWENLLKVRPIGIKDNFLEMGGQSIVAVQLFHQIETVFGKKLPVNTIFEAPTIEALANLLKQDHHVTSASSLVPLQAVGFKQPFFCICGLGSYAFYYLPLALSLERDRPVYGLQTQVDVANPAAVSIRELATCYLRQVRALQPRGPYLLGGHSAGGMVAFEMAQQLKTSGETVAILALFDTAYAGYFRLVPSRYTIHAWKQKASYRFRRLVRLKWGQLGADSDHMAVTNHRCVRPESPLPQGFQAFWKLDHKALRTYAPRPYRGRVVVFRARESYRELYIDSDLGWSQIIVGDLEIRDVPGDHVTLLKRPHVESSARELSRLLDEIDKKQSSNN